MILCSSDGRLCLNLLPGAIASIQAEAAKQHPTETGGVLLGYYDQNFRLATVTTATPPPADSRHGRTNFERGTMGLNEILIWAKEQDPPCYYLGEWHTHPASSAKASSVDVRQMNWFAFRCLYGARSPLLLVVGGTPLHQLEWQATMHRGLWQPHISLGPL